MFTEQKHAVKLGTKRFVSRYTGSPILIGRRRRCLGPLPNRRLQLLDASRQIERVCPHGKLRNWIFIRHGTLSPPHKGEFNYAWLPASPLSRTTPPSSCLSSPSSCEAVRPILRLLVRKYGSSRRSLPPVKRCNSRHVIRCIDDVHPLRSTHWRQSYLTDPMESVNFSLRMSNPPTCPRAIGGCEIWDRFHSQGYDAQITSKTRTCG